MTSSRPRSRSLGAGVAAIALCASVFAGAGVANAADTGSVADTGVTPAAANAEKPSTGSLKGDSLKGKNGEGSLESPIVQAGGMILLGLAVSAALAIGAGIQGGAFKDITIPGVPPLPHL